MGWVKKINTRFEKQKISLETEKRKWIHPMITKQGPNAQTISNWSIDKQIFSNHWKLLIIIFNSAVLPLTHVVPLQWRCAVTYPLVWAQLFGSSNPTFLIYQIFININIPHVYFPYASSCQLTWFALCSCGFINESMKHNGHIVNNWTKKQTSKAGTSVSSWKSSNISSLSDYHSLSLKLGLAFFSLIWEYQFVNESV